MKTLNGIRPLQVFSLAVFLACVAAQSEAQNPAADEFNPSSWYAALKPDGLAIQGDGKVVIGDNRFGTLNPYSILRLDTDGTADTIFDPQPQGDVTCVAVQADGKILIGGGFFRVNNEFRYQYLARFHADGTLDLSFEPLVNANVNCLAVQSDARILVGGNFTAVGGKPYKYLARLHPDGTLDASFNPQPNGPINCIVVQPDGKMVVSGRFSNIGGTNRQYLCRLNLDGTLDPDFQPAPGGTVNPLALQADGKVLVGGWFTSFAGQPRGYVARLNGEDGSLDMGFNPVATGWVESIGIQADGKIVLGGSFLRLGTRLSDHIGRVNPDGSLDSSFDAGANANVKSVAIQSDGKILIGGNFDTLAGQPRHMLGRLNNTDPATQQLSFNQSVITWLRSGSSSEVWRTTFEFSTNNGINWVSLGSGTRISGGWQLTADSLPAAANIRARGYLNGWYHNASSWYVESIAGPALIVTQPQSRTNLADTTVTFSVAAGGNEPLSFQWRKGDSILTDAQNRGGTQTPTLTLSNVLGGDAGEYSAVISNSFGSVTSAVAVLTVTDPIITNVFTLSDYVTAGESVVFEAGVKGTQPMTLYWRKNGVDLPEAKTPTWTLTNVQPPDAGLYTVLASNQFGTATGSIKYLYVNSVTPEPFDPNIGGSINAVAIQPDGKLVIGGAFTNIAGTARQGLARLNRDGALDTNFHEETAGPVNCLAIQDDGKILVGGGFTNFASLPYAGIGRLHPDGSPDGSFHPGPDGSVNCFALQPDGKILVGGSFTNIAGYPRNRIARLNPDGSLDASFSTLAGADYDVYCLALQRNGQILVGGGFTNLAGQVRSGLGRLNADGTLDATFSPAAEGTVIVAGPVLTFIPARVYSLSIQPDGKILAGGNFVFLAGVLSRGIGRLNSDGAIDTAVPSSLSAYEVYSLALQSDGRIVVGGAFDSLAGHTVDNIGRLNSDGTPDRNFNPGANGKVNAVAIQDDGNVLLGGDFTEVNGAARNGLARLDNNIPASQSVSLDGTALLWLRDGSSPEVWRTLFSASTNNGADWFDIGPGVPIAGGWIRSGVILPHSSIIRARGFVTGGAFNGSSWFVENIPANHAPVADVSATKLAILSTNGSDAIMVLDGSLSSDPDGPLQYTWYLVGNPTPLGYGALIPALFPAGAHTLMLKVDDGIWNSTTTFTAEVLTDDQPIGQLRSKLFEGHIQLDFFAANNHTYTVQASTNLLHWESLGQALAQPDMAHTFEDVDSARWPTRFYRVLAP